MTYLAIAILCSSLFAVIFKLCQQRQIDALQVICINYTVGVILSWAPIALNILMAHQAIESYSLTPLSIVLSCMQGGLFMMGFITMNQSTCRNGVALTTVSARASLILPVTFSWLILSQPAPKWIPVAGVILAMLMIILPNKQQDHAPSIYRLTSDAIRKRKAAIALCSVFIFYGIADFSLKLVQFSVENAYRDDETLNTHLTALTGAIFFMSAALSFILCLVKGSFRKHPLNWAIIGWGALLGAVNVGCTACMLRALGMMPTGHFYPLYNIGIVLASTIIGICFFKERIKIVQLLGFILAIAAIAFFF